jgi:hypothetical protein
VTHRGSISPVWERSSSGEGVSALVGSLALQHDFSSPSINTTRPHVADEGEYLQCLVGAPSAINKPSVSVCYPSLTYLKEHVFGMRVSGMTPCAAGMPSLARNVPHAARPPSRRGERLATTGTVSMIKFLGRRCLTGRAYDVWHVAKMLAFDRHSSSGMWRFWDRCLANSVGQSLWHGNQGTAAVEIPGLWVWGRDHERNRSDFHMKSREG